MKKIAIQGHSTRGKDVINILKLLGGKDPHNFSGNRETCYYFINAGDRIDLCSKKNKLMSLSSHTFYTLEEYEQKFNNMENKRTIQIDLNTAKEWYKQGGDLQKIALQAFSEKELKPLPASWKEYCEMDPYLDANKAVFLLTNGDISPIPSIYYAKRNFSGALPSKERAEQFVILNKLLQIRDYYNQGWVPNWCASLEEKYCIINNRNELTITAAWVANYLFVFKTKELRDEFFKNFKEDLETIKEFL